MPADSSPPDRRAAAPLRTGWTTGTCAAAAARAAAEALWTGRFPDPVAVTLPNGARPVFALACSDIADGCASAGIVKDAGDDPDVTHGALILATVRLAPEGAGVLFRAGPGVGTVTRPGLPVPPGEPAINPVPRRMMRAAIAEAAALFQEKPDVCVEISVPGGEALARKTLNPRLGIAGGISILGTTGIVKPYSCSAWIASVHMGVDVARAAGLTHIAGATGATSGAAVLRLYGLPETALIDMGDFAGGLLKYLKTHPVPRLTIAGGFAKMSKLACGRLDLHSKRGGADLAWLAERLAALGAPREAAETARAANTAQEILDLAASTGTALGGAVAEDALATVLRTLAGSGIEADTLVFNQEGALAGRSFPAVA